MRWSLPAALFLAGCGGSDGPVHGVALPPIAAPAPAPGFRIDGAVERPASYTAADLATRPAVTQAVSFASGGGPQSHVYTGASLWSLLNAAGLRADASRKNDLLGRYALATGADGYQVAFALGELNPDFGNKPSLVAYAETTAGTSQALPGSDGPFRVTAPGDVKGGRYVSGLVRLEVRASASTASGTGGGVAPSFAVSGAVGQPASFDLAALQALPATTQVVGNVSYTGVSLWTLLNAAVGLKTDPKQKNASLSMYAVATGSDGYKALVSLGEIDPNFGNKPALVAYSADGAALGRNGMARLIMPADTRQGRSVSNLVAIEVVSALRSQ